MRNKLSHKITFAATTWALLTVLAGGVVFYCQSTMMRLQREIVRSDEVVATLNSILIDVIDMETGIRGYLLSGEESYFEPFTAVEGLFEQEIRRANQLAAADPELALAIQEIVKKKVEWTEGPVMEEMMSRRKLKAGKIGHEDFIKAFLASRGKQLTDQIRVVARAALEREKKRIDTYNGEQQRASVYVNWSVQFGLTAGILLGYALLMIITQKITRPVARLTEAMESAIKGNLDARVEITSTDEVGVMSKIYNSMVEEIKQSRHKIESYARDLEKKVEERTRDVVLSKKKIQEILDNIDQGIVTFGSDHQIESEFSAYVASFYDHSKDQIAGRKFSDILFPAAKFPGGDSQMMQAAVGAMLGEDEFAWELNSEHLPRECVIGVKGEEKIVGLDWTPIVTEGRISRMMLSVRDRTQQRKLEREVQMQREAASEQTRMIMEMIPYGRSKLQVFFDDMSARLTRCEQSLSGDWDAKALFIELHTLKGGARILGFQKLMNAAHVAEEPVQKLRDGNSSNDFMKEQQMKFLALFAELKTEFGKYRGMFSKVFLGAIDEQAGKGARTPEALSMLPAVHQQFESLKETLRQKGLRVDRISCEDNVIDWRPEAFGAVTSMLTHALTNSLDHGYLRDSNRGRFPAWIEFTVKAASVDDRVVIEVADRGWGLDLDKIRAIADQKGLLNPRSTEADVERLLFLDGFSTAEKVTELSGRGVGLSAIRRFAEDLGGGVNITNRPGGGTVLTIRLPKKAVKRVNPEAPLKESA